MSAQEEFDKKYITSAEICKELKVSRVVLMAARIKGLLPCHVNVNHGQIYIWEREAVMPHMAALAAKLGTR